MIHATGRLHGDVEAPSLVVARGAYFNGRIRMYRPERSLQTDAPASRDSVEPQPRIGAPFRADLGALCPREST